MNALVERYRVSHEPLRSERRLELAALVLAGLFVAQLAYSTARLATLAPPEPITPSEDTLLVAGVTQRAEVSDPESAEINARPLFWHSRRPPPPPDAAPVEPVQENAGTNTGNIDKVRLLGVFGGGDSAGIIAQIDGSQKRIMKGETVEGWTLSSVRGNRAVFKNGGNKHQLALKPGNAGGVAGE